MNGAILIRCWVPLAIGIGVTVIMGILPFTPIQPPPSLIIAGLVIGVGLTLIGLVGLVWPRGKHSGKEQPKVAPMEVAFEVKSLRRLTLTNQILGEGPEEDVEVLTDILFTPKHPPVKPLQVMLEIHSKRIPASTLMGDVREQISQPYFFIVPKALAKDTMGRIIVTTDQGSACSKPQTVRFSSAER